MLGISLTKNAPRLKQNHLFCWCLPWSSWWSLILESAVTFWVTSWKRSPHLFARKGKQQQSCQFSLCQEIRLDHTPIVWIILLDPGLSWSQRSPGVKPAWTWTDVQPQKSLFYNFFCPLKKKKSVTEQENVKKKDGKRCRTNFTLLCNRSWLASSQRCRTGSPHTTFCIWIKEKSLTNCVTLSSWRAICTQGLTFRKQCISTQIFQIMDNYSKRRESNARRGHLLCFSVLICDVK